MAVFGSAIATVAVLAPLAAFDWVPLAVAFAICLVLAMSRYLTRSITPAVVAQGVTGAVAAAFALLSALS